MTEVYRVRLRFNEGHVSINERGYIVYADPIFRDQVGKSFPVFLGELRDRRSLTEYTKVREFD